MKAASVILLCILCGAAMAKLRCGNDGIQHGIAQNILQNDCKGRLGKIDACCVNHTNCYKQKSPQKVCDDTFCDCINQAANALPLCSFHANNFCATARTFGGFQYNKPPQ
ncbi:hypothetical protein ANCCAN_07518 [Ancylostoma caninum]|uniref:Phospholipase A2 n=1 Tax=Ancylostoma caninum TaxID=29170 RepID=A0A368GTQ5_ANCCA|nr:hypothetical protein ANCCAN_07518 [Ancylostoma caninum]